MCPFTDKCVKMWRLHRLSAVCAVCHMRRRQTLNGTIIFEKVCFFYIQSFIGQIKRQKERQKMVIKVRANAVKVCVVVRIVRARDAWLTINFLIRSIPCDVASMRCTHTSTCTHKHSLSQGDRDMIRFCVRKWLILWYHLIKIKRRTKWI